MTKQFRQARVLEILREGPVASQAELARRLRRSRIRVSQATLSRDLRELGVLWGPEGYTLPGDMSPGSRAEDPSRILREFVRSAELAGNLAVVRTDPGHAHTLAVTIDRAGWDDVVGSLAGDDTVFLAARDAARARKILARIKKVVS